MDVTTQLNNKDADSTLSRRFSNNDRVLRYKRLDSLFHTDTFYIKQVVSKQGFSMMQIFVIGKGFVKVYKMKYDKEFVKALKIFCKEVGAPKAFIVDPHPYHKKQSIANILKQSWYNTSSLGGINPAL